MLIRPWKGGRIGMLYVILSYDVEAKIDAWTPEQGDAQMARFGSVQQELAAQGRLGPAIRLGATADAKTWRPAAEPVVIDGPFAETKEQLLGLYVVDCASSDEAIALARRLSHGSGSFEIRPIERFFPATLR
jgi:hypothetical protein